MLAEFSVSYNLMCCFYFIIQNIFSKDTLSHTQTIRVTVFTEQPRTKQQQQQQQQEETHLSLSNCNNSHFIFIFCLFRAVFVCLFFTWTQINEKRFFLRIFFLFCMCACCWFVFAMFLTSNFYSSFLSFSFSLFCYVHCFNAVLYCFLYAHQKQKMVQFKIRYRYF